MKKWPLLLLVLSLMMAMPISCSDDPIVEPGDGSDVNGPDNPGAEDPFADAPVMGEVTFFNGDRVDDNFILVNDAGANRAYVMTKKGQLAFEWDLTNNIGNDVFLLPDGRLLASLEADEPKLTFGGQGGKLQFVLPDNSVEWEFIYSSEEAETHHDAELLPNGNVIALAWEKLPAQQALEAGSVVDMDLYPESIIEVDPRTNEIVWEWHAWDHLIQDHDPSRENFGVVADHPELIDFNYTPRNNTWPNAAGNIMHANAIAYDAENDVILVSMNWYSEIWAIDHSTTTAEAAGHSGGRYGKGGDLIYRFGNPGAYGNPAGVRLFHNQHFPNLLQGADQGKLLIFSNGNDVEQSTIYELQLPAEYTLLPNTDNEPQILWSFTDPELYAPRVSGANVLTNGNILITQGNFGLWEVTRDQEVVWKFSADGFFWRSYPYDKGSIEMQAIGLEP